MPQIFKMFGNKRVKGVIGDISLKMMQKSGNMNGWSLNEPENVPTVPEEVAQIISVTTPTNTEGGIVELRKQLDAKGITYDKRWGAKKLKQLLNQ